MKIKTWIAGLALAFTGAAQADYAEDVDALSRMASTTAHQTIHDSQRQPVEGLGAKIDALALIDRTVIYGNHPEWLGRAANVVLGDHYLMAEFLKVCERAVDEANVDVKLGLTQSCIGNLKTAKDMRGANVDEVSLQYMTDESRRLAGVENIAVSAAP